MKRQHPDKQAYALFHDATLALSHVEQNGIKVDEGYLNSTIERVQGEVKTLQRELKSDPVFTKTWMRRFGDKTKLSAQDQLGKVFFEELGFERAPIVEKKSKKTDSESMAEAVFADVDHPFVKKWFRWKRYKDKVLSTYLYNIRRETIHGRCHPHYNLNLAISYRSTSDNFNFQNIPKRDPEIADLIRRCFVAINHFGEIDYSQAEVRGAAVYSEDGNLIKYINDKSKDMHYDTAGDLFFLKREQISKAIRHIAKNMFVFPEFYGATWFQQALMIWHEIDRRQVKLERTDVLLTKWLRQHGIKELGSVDPKEEPVKGTFAHHVKNVERIMWDKRFRQYRDWKVKWYNEYCKRGSFKAKTGFVYEGFMKKNEVLSYAIQGTAFHWMLWSLVQIHRWLRKNNMKTRLIGQIHDSIEADIHPKEKDDFIEKCHQVMTQDIHKHWDWIIVPLEVEAEISPIGGSWAEVAKQE
jgi:DNA polymerase-1